MPAESTPAGHVQSLHLHPVKSCRRIDVDEATVGPFGLVGDREWQIVTEKGVPVTQRQQKSLAVLQPSVTDTGLRLSTPSGNSIDIAEPGPDSPEGLAFSLFRVPVPCLDAGDETAAWLSAYVGEPVRLVRVADGDHGDAGWRIPEAFEAWTQPLAFVDVGPVLITTTASLDWLLARAIEPFGHDRFRPNIVVANETAWDEDTWAEATVGSAVLGDSLPWPRCAIPQIDQDDAVRHREPALVLKAHRWCAETDLTSAMKPVIEGNALFGIGGPIGPIGAVIRVGDPVTVTRRREPLLAPPE